MSLFYNPGATVAGGLLFGSGGPSNNLGSDGQGYVDTVNNLLYIKSFGTWTIYSALTGGTVNLHTTIFPFGLLGASTN